MEVKRLRACREVSALETEYWNVLLRSVTKVLGTGTVRSNSGTWIHLNSAQDEGPEARRSESHHQNNVIGKEAPELV